MSKINKTPDFLGMAEVLKRKLQKDAEIQGMDFIHQNFYDQGWHGSTFEAWEPRKHPLQYLLLIISNSMFNSIGVESSSLEQVVFTAESPYAAVHNEGLSVNATARVEKYINRNFMGKGKSVEIKAHLRRINYKMTKRQFMGESDMFDKQWNDHVSNEIITRFKQL
ncbi:hypothetical protein KO504_16960 [Winogradskyella psychrotolerans]|uniref:hypothetical protein n=1 Tax=Winogradskyella psychrotolerans TaxID=1344585 RepID=UPI001C079BCF|nr:hypothetical protein [Winogradskyella psychrotolerans]MBU2923042.1 hypothetical protein [Winogradskyella psychrotolerans]